MTATSFTPRETVSELDRYIIGQSAAKRAVAVALRNRWRRQQLPEDMREEVLPKNILMVGPTGVGKTEISRRLAKLSNAPFIKVEATKFTEVGYVGRDVEQIIRDLVDNALMMIREKKHRSVSAEAELMAENRVLDALCGEDSSETTRQKFRKMLREGDLAEKEVEFNVADTSNPFGQMDIPGMPGGSVGMLNLGDVMGKAMGQRTVKKKMKIKDAYAVLMAEESDKLIDEESMTRDALSLVEQNGIVFLDEIDKICTRNDARGGEVSREGVQRDLLPLIEGTSVSTKHGVIKTDHILFIASGAFHLSKPSDLLPELQGRLPIRVELRALSEEDFRRILTEPDYSLIRQYEALIGTEGVALSFSEDGIAEIARISAHLNETVENIGARRLHTVLEKVLESISFDATDHGDDPVLVDAAYVKDNMGDLALGGDADLSKFIL